MSDSAAVAEMDTNPSCAQDGVRTIASQSTTDNEDNHFPAARRSRSGTRMPRTCLGLLAMAHAASATNDHRRRLNVDAVSAVQSGTAGFPGRRPATVGTTPIWDMGLHGEGEIVGVMSTGLDGGHCFFENAAGEIPVDQVYGPSHRKIVSYRAHADGGALLTTNTHAAISSSNSKPMAHTVTQHTQHSPNAGFPTRGLPNVMTDLTENPDPTAPRAMSKARSVAHAAPALGDVVEDHFLEIIPCE